MGYNEKATNSIKKKMFSAYFTSLIRNAEVNIMEDDKIELPINWLLQTG
jgi:hypothetical protein